MTGRKRLFDVVLGIVLLSAGAALISLWVVGLEWTVGPFLERETGRTLWEVIRRYFAAAFVAGVILGLLRRYASTWWKAGLTGSATAIPIYAILWKDVWIKADGISEVLDAIPYMLSISVMVGFVVGVVVRRQYRSGPIHFWP